MLRSKSNRKKDSGVIKLTKIKNKLAPDVRWAHTDAKDRNLIQAVSRGKLDEVRILLEDGADPNALNYFGYSALQLAVKFAALEIAKLLIDNNANVKESVDGKTTLEIAEETRNEDMIRLIRRHATKTRTGKTKAYDFIGEEKP